MSTAAQSTLFDIEWQLGETRDVLIRQAVAAERQAVALEGLLALLTAHLTAAAPAAPADAPCYFDTLVGNPLAALDNVTAPAAPQRPTK